MIQMNMLKQRPIVRGLPSEKEGAKLFGVIVVSAVLGAVLFFGIWQVFQAIMSPSEDGSGFTNVSSAESVESISVGELSDSVSGELVPTAVTTTYENMSMFERFNYERVYAYYLFREITLIVPSDVDFSLLEMDNYSSVDGEGFVKSKDGVLSLFSSLKKGSWDLAPRPASVFRSFEDGFQFRFESQFTVEPSSIDASVITKTTIPTSDHLQSIKDSITTVITASPVSSEGALELHDRQSEGVYQHYFYTISGRSDFSQFKDMLKGILQLKAAVSIPNAKLVADDGNINWTMIVKVTVK